MLTAWLNFVSIVLAIAVVAAAVVFVLASIVVDAAALVVAVGAAVVAGALAPAAPKLRLAHPNRHQPNRNPPDARPPPPAPRLPMLDNLGSIFHVRSPPFPGKLDLHLCSCLLHYGAPSIAPGRLQFHAIQS